MHLSKLLLITRFWSFALRTELLFIFLKHNLEAAPAILSLLAFIAPARS
jgi:hypothetical protein